MRSRRFSWVVALLLLTGCASGLKGLEIPNEEALYDVPLEELWPSVRQFFTDNRLPFREDKGSYVLQTEWREEFGGSRVSGFWHRYLVLGKRESPTRGKLWIIRVTRSANNTLASAGRELDWGMSRSLFEASGGEAGLSPGGNPNMSIEDQADLQDAPRGDNAVLTGSAQGSRDLVMEWKVYRALAPTLVAKTSTEPPPVRVAQVPGGPKVSPSALVECGAPILGLLAQLKPGALLLLGELHGTQEVPRFIAQSACQAASSGLPVTVGLELPVAHQERVAAFLRGEGQKEDWAKLMEASFWRAPYQDGRSSEAVALLLEQLRLLRAQGLDVDAFVFDHPGTQGQEHEELMAGTVLARMRAAPQRFFLVASGNIHTRTVQGLPWDRGYRPMGERLSRQLEDVVALDVAYNNGSAWICSVGDGQRELDCGVRPARGKDNGDRFFVHRFDGPSQEGFHGIFYVGPVTASLPAVRRGVGAPE